MGKPLSVGFPRMMKEPAERRVFLPEFVHFMDSLGLEVFIEEGYGARSGFTLADYDCPDICIQACSHEEAYQKDIVIVLRSPKTEEMKMIPAGTILVSMLHYSTRPRRVEMLKELGIKSISLDSLENDAGIRLVENMQAVAWNGLEAAFDVLERCIPSLYMSEGEPVRVLILGTGMVGKYAVDAACKMGSIERNNRYIEAGKSGSMALCVGRNTSTCAAVMEKLLPRADILVDATQRRDTSRPVVPNEWIGLLPEHAVIVDLAVDPYSIDSRPPVVRGIEGIPQGNLDQYVFLPNDPGWDATVPASIPSSNRRTVVSCYSWPGIHPEACMRHYGAQIEPLIEELVDTGYDDLSKDGTYFDRALYRASLKAWLASAHYRRTGKR